MSEEFPLKEIDGKMECPFCKIVVKNVKLHFVKRIECGEKVDKDHFLPNFDQHKKRKDLENNRIRKQKFKERDPLKYKAGYYNSNKQKKEEDPAEKNECRFIALGFSISA